MVDRHNSVARNVYYWLCKKYGLPTFHHTERIPNPNENESAKLLWDLNIQVEKSEVISDRPDIVAIDKSSRKVYVIEVSVSWFENLKLKREEKFAKYAKNSTLKYEDLAKAIKSGRGVSYDTTLVGEMAKLRNYRNYEIIVVPVIIGCCGEVGTQLWSDLGRLPIEITDSMIERLSRSAVCGTNRVILAHTSKE